MKKRKQKKNSVKILSVLFTDFGKAYNAFPQLKENKLTSKKLN